MVDRFYVTGAIQHAMAALECAARDTVGKENATLGDLIRRNPGFFQGRSIKRSKRCGAMRRRPGDISKKVRSRLSLMLAPLVPPSTAI